MRSDFYGKCAQYEQFSALVADHNFLVGEMSKEELRQAILQPAQLNGVGFEAGLVDQLLFEVQNTPGALPLLQDALRALWEHRDGATINYAALAEIGGLAGALDRRADAIYENLSPAKKALCKSLFLRMTQPGEGTEDTKRRVTLEELSTLPGEEERIRELVYELSGEKSRLLRVEVEEEEVFVEVAHEALIRNWQLLRGWIDQERESLLIHRRLTRDMEEWLRSGKNEDFLYTGSRLTQVQEWVVDYEHDINRREEAFIAESIERREAVVKAAGKRRRTVVTAGAAAIVVLAALGIVLAITLQKQRASTRQIIGIVLEESRQLIRNLEYEQAWSRLQSAAASNVYPDSIGRDMLEVAYVFNEYGQHAQAIAAGKEAAALLNTTVSVRAVEEDSLSSIRSGLESIHPDHFAFLKKRYYPDMIDFSPRCIRIEKREVLTLEARV